MLEAEVAGVIKALVENGIEVVAVHSHMVDEEPRIFFLHYWGVGEAEKLATGLKAALDQTGRSTKPTSASYPDEISHRNRRRPSHRELWWLHSTPSMLFQICVDSLIGDYRRKL